MRIRRGFPQQHSFPHLTEVSNNDGPNATGPTFPPYPHLGITLWITEPAPGKAFSVVHPNFTNKSNRLDKEATCG